MIHSGGAAVNAGIDFQQRVAALAMAHCITGTTELRLFGLQGRQEIREIRFETADAVDDLVLGTDQGRLFVQAKNTLNLSGTLDSPFSSVLLQFARQAVCRSAEQDAYIIATSSQSSERVTKELRKLTEGMRLNETGSTENPTTEVEKEVLAKARYLIGEHAKRLAVKEPAEEFFAKVFRKIHVAVLDIEDGAQHESLALTLLASRSVIASQLVWSALISLGLSLSRDRLSIDRDGLETRVGRYLSPHTAKEDSNIARETLALQFGGVMPSAFDVVLVRHNEDAEKLAIFQLFRFGKDGAKRTKFFDEKCELMDGLVLTVIARFATFAGLERSMDRLSQVIGDSEVTIFAAKEGENAQDDPYVKAHAHYCQRYIESNPDPFRCIHCGDPVSEDKAAAIEIDQLDADYAAGLSHARCLQPADRIVGSLDAALFSKYQLLKDFDYKAWFDAIQRGQGLFGGLVGAPKQVYPILRNPKYNDLSRGGWCVRINLEDGSARYAHERARVVRKSKDGASAAARELSAEFKDAREQKNPWCYTSGGTGFGKYADIVKMTGGEHSYVPCVSAEAVPFTKTIGDVFSTHDSFYAPLAVLLERATGAPISFNEAIFLISSPFSLGKYFENWTKAGLAVPEFSVSIIRTDDEFDKFVGAAEAKGLAVVVDPLLAMNGEPISGFVIENYEAWMKEHGGEGAGKEEKKSED